MTVDLSYFRKVGNSYNSSSRQETELYEINRHINDRFNDSISYIQVLRNGEPFELIVERDTRKNNHIKLIKSRPGQPFNAGDYVQWDNHIWLIAEIDPDSRMQNHGLMYLCTYLLKWQNRSGDIIERWVYSEDFTKYSSGQYKDRVMRIGDYQFGFTLPVDEETKAVTRDKRFIIDFEGNYPPNAFRVTNLKIFLNDNTYFNRGGVLTWTMGLDFFDEKRDKLVTLPEPDDSNVWIADYKDVSELGQTNATNDSPDEQSTPDYDVWWR